MKLKLLLRRIFRKVKEFYRDEWGGSLVEYALLIGFALFIFFIIVGIVTGMLDWVQDLVTDFSELFG